ncbi:Ataxin-10 (Spinocerebellar ataxia type 10 protein homolog) [Durusdinium trenchii]|uniref:Ataxin-10 (Spinocerebellar ataxia type 10 protein homolog) n=1 Tax=Durusdinium trenchii TaxID=1381693 RepID=A0ABP0KNT7_9DINO
MQPGDVRRLWDTRDLAALPAVLAEAHAVVAVSVQGLQDLLVDWLDSQEAPAEASGLPPHGWLVDGIQACVLRMLRASGQEVGAPERLAWTAGFPDGLVADVLVEALRLVRNLCTDQRGQTWLAKPLVPGLTRLLGATQALHDGGLGDAWRQRVLALARVLPQVLQNACTQAHGSPGDPGHQEAMRDLVGGDACFLPALSHALQLGAATKDAKLVRNVVMLVWVVLGNNDPPRAQVLAGSRDVIVQLLSVAPLVLNEGVLDEQAAAADAHAHLVWLFEALVLLGHAETIFSHCGHNDQARTAFIALWYGARLEEEAGAAGDQGEESGSPDGSTSAAAQLVGRSFDALTDQYVAKAEARRGSEDAEASDLEAFMLRLLGSLSVDERVYSERPCKRELLQTVLGQLAEPGTPLHARVDLLRVVGNVCFRRPTNQDAVRAVPGGLFVVLNQTGVAALDSNRFLREWAIICIRNLTESNPANQAAIAQLRLQGTVDEGLLAKAGLKLAHTSDGKPKIVRI